jgi:hypothetical protein
MNVEEVRAAEIDLVKLIEGTVIRVGDPGYDSTLDIDNGRIRHRPYLVAVASSTRDVASVVRYCSKYDLRLTTKAGGHSAAGYCLNSEGVVLDLSDLNSIRSTAHGSKLTVGMGSRWITVYNYLQQQESRYMVIGGGCGTVGLGGYLLGGGYSFLSRSFGLAADSITAMEVVSADGSIHTLAGTTNDRNEADLYWALRGGGGGNFGVVTNVDLQLHKTVVPDLLMGVMAFPMHRLFEIMSFYNSWILTLPNEMAVYGMIRRFPDPKNGGKPTLFLHLNSVYNGKFTDGMALLKPLIDRQPANIEVYSMTLPEWENFIGNGTSIAGRSAYIRSAILATGSLDTAVANILTDYMNTAPSQDSFIVWTHAGGKIKEPAEDISSFAHRDGEFVFELKAIWDRSLPQQARPNIEWAVDFFDELEKHSQGAYLNYIDPLLKNWQTKYYRHLYERLLSVKAHWDPKGKFAFQQGIGSHFDPTRTRPLDLSPLLKT